MKVIYLDCPTGASGNMILAGLIDAGASWKDIERSLRRLPVKGWKVELAKVKRCGLGGLQLEVKPGPQPCRHLKEIETIIKKAGLSGFVTDNSITIFTRLAEAESKVHRISKQKIHFHEVGAIDAIIDIVGSCLALEELGAKEVYCSPLNLGHGQVKCQHGTLPVPAPATAQLLKNAVIYQNDLSGELVTPTGAAIITHFAEGFGPMPKMILKSVGNGAGTRELAQPNLLRVLAGELMPDNRSPSDIVMLETNIDDLSPQIYQHLLEILFKQGALDVYFTPIQMKKNRPAVMFSVLTGPENEAAMLDTIFSETTTLGIRRRELERYTLPRRETKVKTAYGPIPGKRVTLYDGSHKFIPEYEECRTIAQKSGQPLMKVIELAKAQFLKEHKR
ncbi:nickel pincer cofactor biosynthesis protein LarC [candidate division TA06 bacterium]|uniref:Putative nickel insertion protein n=1 Tax=candidate division TA06 bacterium TaxID=2250710 RepID=A0A933I7K0_UNCT6|nr:nickel pincer cofactor biosynthesis protein LarC [candidate division TA06 bacterium]